MECGFTKNQTTSLSSNRFSLILNVDSLNRSLTHCHPFTSPLPPHVTMIYFIRNEETNKIKIGYSKDPEERLRTLQTGSSGKLTLLLAIEGTAARRNSLA